MHTPHTAYKDSLHLRVCVHTDKHASTATLVVQQHCAWLCDRHTHTHVHARACSWTLLQGKCVRRHKVKEHECSKVPGLNVGAWAAPLRANTLHPTADRIAPRQVTTTTTLNPPDATAAAGMRRSNLVRRQCRLQHDNLHTALCVRTITAHKSCNHVPTPTD